MTAANASVRKNCLGRRFFISIHLGTNPRWSPPPPHPRRCRDERNPRSCEDLLRRRLAQDDHLNRRWVRGQDRCGKTWTKIRAATSRHVAARPPKIAFAEA